MSVSQDNEKSNSILGKIFPLHLADLRKSGLTDETIGTMHVESIDGKELQRRLGTYQKAHSAMVLRYPGTDYERYKIFTSEGGKVLDSKGKPINYLQKKQSPNRLYIMEQSRRLVYETGQDLWIIEGEKKTVAGVQHGLDCSVGISGAFNCFVAGTKCKDLIADFDNIPLADRKVFLVIDGDWQSQEENKRNIMLAVYKAGVAFKERYAKPFVIVMPNSKDGKVGLDDYLLKNSIKDFKSLQKVKVPDHKMFKDNGFKEGSKTVNANETMIDAITMSSSIYSPHIVAEMFLKKKNSHLYIDKEWYRYNGKHYDLIEDEGEIESSVQRFLKTVFLRSEKGEVTPLGTGSRVLHDIMKNIRCECFAHARFNTFLKGRKISIEHKNAREDSLICLSNGLYDVKNDKMLKHTPDYFCVNGLSFNYEPEAECPVWTENLKGMVDDDAYATLQQWFGYHFTAGNPFQRFLLLVGLPGSGKSTIQNILQHLIGEKNYIGFTFSGLGSQFGMQQFLGKSAAFSGDAHFSNNFGKDHVLVLERFKQITGGDVMEIDRKNLRTISARLSTKLTLAVNTLPKLNDKSNALHRRVMIAMFPKEVSESKLDSGLEKFYRENEISGIFNWALDGLKTLLKNGKSGFNLNEKNPDDESIEGQFMRANNPIECFLRDCCSKRPENETERMQQMIAPKEFYDAWSRYCKQNGYLGGASNGFEVTMLGLGVPKKKVAVKMDNGDTRRVWRYIGVELLPEHFWENYSHFQPRSSECPKD